MTSKKLVNVPSLSSKEACEGLLLLRPDLAAVEGYPGVIVRRDILAYKVTRVTLVSGGGSGHEPAHAGYVGEGLLSAAVCGNVFASPSVSEILAAIRVCGSSRHGVLLIVKNYTGDRINFGLALEKAVSEGIKTMMIVVDDDVALPEGKGITGGRGVAGTIFIHKLAGALAMEGKSLEEIHAKLSAVVGKIGSLGIALTTCTVPGSEVSTRLIEQSTMEVGMGIHGEPGREQRALSPGKAADEAARLMVDAIVDRKKFVAGDDLVIIINNLGGLSVLELQVVSKCVVTLLKSRGFILHRALWGHYMTSLEMSGVSLSILSMGELKDDFLTYFDLPVKAVAWNNNNIIKLTDADYESIAYNPLRKSTLSGGPECSSTIPFVEAVCVKLIELNKELNHLDSLSGDGDCGFTMNNLGVAIQSWLSATREQNGAEYQELQHSGAHFLNELAAVVSGSGGGTSGVLLELFLLAASNHFVNKSGVDALGIRTDWIAALCKGRDAICAAGGAKVGMRTLLDALIPALDELSRGNSVVAASAAASSGMELTKTLEAKAGRANYVPKEKFQGFPDPGALVVAEVFKTAVIFFA